MGPYVLCVVILQLCVSECLSARDFSRVLPTCTTPDCVKAASEIMHYIDQNVNPCDDFYEFACGTFLNNVHLKNEPLINVETIMRDNYLSRIRVIMQEPVLHNDSNSMIMAKKMHEACMNPSSSENGVKLIENTLRQIGGWAVLEEDDWDDSYFHWAGASYLLRKMGFPHDYLVKVSVSEENGETAQLEIGNPWSYINLHTPEEEDLLHDYMVDIAIAFGADPEAARGDYADVIDLIKNLMGIDNYSGEDPIVDDDVKRAYLTISELEEKFSDVAWSELLENLLEPVVKMNVDQVILVTDMPYLYSLEAALKNTSERTLNNFIAWRLIIEHSNILTNDLAEISRKFYKELNKQVTVPTLSPINKMCSGIVETIFSLSLQAAYVQRFVSQAARDDAADILENIMKEFVEEINELHGMDDETRISAIDRVVNITSYVAYPDAMLDADQIEERYLGYQISDDNLLASLLSVNYHKVNSYFSKLNKGDNEVEDNGGEINEKYTTYGIVYYLASDNSITIPHRMLQDIVYNEDRPKYLNYGSLGSFIGHQIFHSVFEGSPIRQESEYYHWMSPESRSEYQKKLDCVAESYERFYVPEIERHVNSTNTKQEDIADIAGVQLAYKAYKEWIDRNGKEKKLPKLDYTPKQLFWISSAIRFCSKGSPETIERAVKHSYQSLKRFRVLGSLQNSKHFSKDFHCPAESNMNSHKKCEIW